MARSYVAVMREGLREWGSQRGGGEGLMDGLCASRIDGSETATLSASSSVPLHRVRVVKKVKRRRAWHTGRCRICCFLSVSMQAFVMARLGGSLRTSAVAGAHPAGRIA